jgi:coatomer protein complex subunit gamma
MLQSIERYMKQAIVDKMPSVSSAALVSSLHLMKQGPEVVKRWVNEVSDTVNSDNVMVQYHALGLLYQIKRNDKLAITKLVAKFSKSSLKSPYAYCFLVILIFFTTKYLINFIYNWGKKTSSYSTQARYCH